MDKKEYKLKQSITALRGSAKGIASAIDAELISSEEVYCLLSTIADRMDTLTDQPAPHQSASSTE